MTIQDWQPTTDLQKLQERAGLLANIRMFFADRGVLEVDTPILSHGTGTDPALEPIRAELITPGEPAREVFLQTSPEFAMKRLLAFGSGPIYQLSRAFRNGESGRRHNPEFTMLEWYRPGFTLDALMDEVTALVSHVLGCVPPDRVTYSSLFMEHLSIDPLESSLEQLKACARERLDISFDSRHPDHWLDLLFSHCIEPAIQAPLFIVNYPPSQAALAKVDIDHQGRSVARRFELVIAGMEIANGYQELTDVDEQRLRFQRDNHLRELSDLPVLPIDERLLAALEHGMPECAGVALGVDRLLMLKTGTDDISQVVSFPSGRA